MRITNDETAKTWLEENEVQYRLEDGDKVRIDKCCSRCGGSGFWSRGHWVQNGVCFKCEGSGNRRTEYITVKAYAQKIKRKRVAQEKARLERVTKAADREERMLEGQRNWCEKNGFGRITFEEKAKLEEEKRAAEAAKKTYIGQVGDKVELEATLEVSINFDTQWGLSFIHKFSDNNGNTVVWKTSKGLHYPDGIDKGNRVFLKGTVKDHNSYKGEKQTILTRCKVRKAA